jgi:SagB-type dehydrogenase family enzyme
MTAPATGLDAVLAYHQRSKHHLRRFAPSPGYLDWATQPDPFRRYAGAPRIELPLAAGLDASWDDALRPGSVPARALELRSLGAFLELALGLTAWKQLGRSRWALRANPSSGNLHPTEAYVLVPSVPGVAAGLHHYLSETHALEGRCRLEGAAAKRLHALVPAGGFLVGLSSIHWREAWKYGERAYRYCQHDVGHALGALRYASAVLGWSARLVQDVPDDVLARLLGLDRAEDFASVPAVESEHADALIVIAPSAAAAEAALRPTATRACELVRLLGAGTWTGRANRLSPSHVHWETIDAVAEAACFPGDGDGEPRDPQARVAALPPLEPRSAMTAASLIRQRRSAVDMDGVTGIEAGAFFRVLDALLPRPGVPPFDVLPWPPRVHTLLFVHRVDGCAPGLYLFERDAGDHDALRAELSPGFLWARVPAAPAHLPLFLLLPSDVRDAARLVSCQQDIASDGAFSLGMLARYRPSLETGPWWYRRLFWEAGVVGQALYLEAEAAGLRGTGIGCYFDDAVQELAGIGSDRFQDLYHFTVGGPVEDARLQGLPGYPDRRE